MAWSDGETRTYAQSGESSISETLDEGFEYNIKVHGADGDGYTPGVGGYAEGNYIVNQGDEDIEIFVGQGGGGYWGKYNGGSSGYAGGGSTEVLLSNPSTYQDSKLVIADAGGGYGSDYYGFDGSGGARDGKSVSDGGSNAEGPPNGSGLGGFGPDESITGLGGGDACGEVGCCNGAKQVSVSRGGSTHPDGTENGYVEITSTELPTATGVVEDGGTAVDGATVELVNQNTEESYKTTTDSSGNWSIGVPSGTYHFTARFEDSEGKKRTLSKPYIQVS